MSFEQAYIEETEEKEEAMEVDGNAEQAAVPKKKKVVKKKDISIVTSYATLDASAINTLRETESQMHASDKLVMDTEVSQASPSGALMSLTIPSGSQKCS